MFSGYFLVRASRTFSEISGTFFAIRLTKTNSVASSTFTKDRLH